MALTLEQLQAQRDKTIQEMSLESRVDFSDRGITRRSQEELEAALRRIDSEIAKLGGASGGFRTTYASMKK